MRNSLTLPVLMVVAALVLLLIWLAQRSAEPDPEVPTGDVIERTLPLEAPAAAAQPAPQAAGSPPIAESPPIAAQPAPAPRPQPESAPARATAVPSERGVVELVKEWAGAWSEQRVDDYLDCYARTFVPEGGLSVNEWQAQRRERISAPRFVRVSITGLETELLDIGAGRATFLQHYRSDGYTDTVRKTLDLVWEDGRWRIEVERLSGAS